jgi:hypothetical protein
MSSLMAVSAGVQCSCREGYPSGGVGCTGSGAQPGVILHQQLMLMQVIVSVSPPC